MPRLFDLVDAGSVLATLSPREVNYSTDELGRSEWKHDLQRSDIAMERPGVPDARGPWETACRLVEAYEFCEPKLVRAVYRCDAPLRGRDMLLEARFFLLRFYMGVRITEVVDVEERDCEQCALAGGPGDRVWGWAYETLEGHLERGRMAYEVIKHQATGRVELVITAFSQGTRTVGPVTRLGWRIFGRRTQLRFYRACGVRLRQAVQSQAGQADPVPTRRTDGAVVLAPSDARSRPVDRLSVRRHDPGD